MKILYDGQTYGQQAAGGINRYFANLISRLPNHYHPTITTCYRRELHYPQHQNLKTAFFQRFGFKPGRLCYWLEKQYFQAVEDFGKFDLLHPTYYNLLTQRQLSGSKLPIVLTVHDMIHEIFPDQLDPTGAFAAIKREAILSAQLILCVSENTKRDLLERIAIPEERIRVIYLATEIALNQTDLTALVPTSPYVLYVGGRRGYKNFDALLKAFARAQFTDLQLRVIGSPFSLEEQHHIANLGLEQQIIHHGNVDDVHLAQLYRSSLALVYPSLYEGFGIPPLEAMACGTAVIAGDQSSIPEIVGDAGLLIDAKNSDALVESLLWLIDQPIEREKLIQKGQQRVQQFSWDKTVAQTSQAYQYLISK
jgi:glycosyltransferase involved in cell wall biosynthesis